MTIQDNTLQLDHFHELGYCVVDDVFTASELQEIEDFFEEFRQGKGALFEGGRNYEDLDPTKGQVRCLHPHRYSKKVEEWYLHPNIAYWLETFLGRPAFGAQTMYYYKPPGARGQGMHQDNFYLLAAPATCIGAWTPIDDADIDNGCLYVVPGSHKGGVLCPDQETSNRWLEYGDSHITHFPRDQRPIPIPVKRGQTLFFSGNLIHGSGPNRTKDRWRRTFIGHYCDAATETLGKFYHPVLNMQGEIVSQVAVHSGGGPCGDGWMGGVH